MQIWKLGLKGSAVGLGAIILGGAGYSITRRARADYVAGAVFWLSLSSFAAGTTASAAWRPT